MPEIQCNAANCTYNIIGQCDNCGIVIEDMECISAEINELYCEVCGTKLIEIKELREHFGIPCFEKLLICPKGC